jgi:NitT/TauT family transport system substrate-binding protein
MRMTLTRTFKVVAAIAAATLLPAAAPAETLKVAYNQWAGFTPVFVAQEKGFFTEAGVTVELVPFPGPGDSLAPLIAGHLDVSLTTPDNVVVLNATADADIKAIYLLDASEGADALVAREGIGSMSDLKGRRVATTVGEVNHLLLLKALESAGLRESDVQLVDMNPDDAGAAFLAGAVDAAVTWEPWVSQAVAAGGSRIFTSADAPNLLLDVVAVSQATIDRKPEALKALLAGIEKGVQFLRENPDEAYELAAKWLDVTGPEVGEMLDGVKVYTRAENKPLMDAAGGEATLIDSLRAISAFLLAQETIASEKDVTAMVVSTFVED